MRGWADDGGCWWMNLWIGGVYRLESGYMDGSIGGWMGGYTKQAIRH